MKKIVICLLLLAGCSQPEEFYYVNVCVRSVPYTTTIMVSYPNGNGGIRMQPQIQTHYRCVERQRQCRDGTVTKCPID